MMIVLALIVALMAITAGWWSFQAKVAHANAQTDMLARELSQVSKAVASVIANDNIPGRDGAIAALPMNTSLNPPITVATLVNMGHLPAGFAERVNAWGVTGVGTSPYGQEYTIVIKSVPKSPAQTDPMPQKPRAIVYETGAPIASALARADVQNVPAQVDAYKRRVAHETQTNYQRIAAAILQGTREAINPSWRLDLAGWLSTNISYSAAVALVGFDYLEPGGSTGPDDEGDGWDNFSGTCEIVTAERGCMLGGAPGNCTNPAAVWQEPACPTGSEKVDAFAACSGAGMAFRSTPVGQLSSFEYLREGREDFGALCLTQCSATHTCNYDQIPEGITWQVDTIVQDIRINDASIATMGCRTLQDANGVLYAGGMYNCGYQRLEHPWANPTIMASNPKNVLCCRRD
ncbi:MAG: hypothetical protein WCZ65_11950 [Lysobacteraceae bacterium]